MLEPRGFKDMIPSTHPTEDFPQYKEKHLGKYVSVVCNSQQNSAEWDLRNSSSASLIKWLEQWEGTSLQQPEQEKSQDKVISDHIK